MHASLSADPVSVPAHWNNRAESHYCDFSSLQVWCVIVLDVAMFFMSCPGELCYLMLKLCFFVFFLNLIYFSTSCFILKFDSPPVLGSLPLPSVCLPPVWLSFPTLIVSTCSPSVARGCFSLSWPKDRSSLFPAKSRSLHTFFSWGIFS